jgi:hypothetical protein
MEVFSGLFLDNLSVFNEIKPISRSSDYLNANRNAKDPDPTSPRKEENTAKMIKENMNCGEIGTIIDFQVPLKNSSNDSGLGKIDLISQKEDTIYLIEFKYLSKETLLRCLLEIETYRRQIDEFKLLGEINKTEFNRDKKLILKKAVLFDEFSKNCDIDLEEYPNTKRLAKKLDISLFKLKNNFCAQKVF